MHVRTLREEATAKSVWNLCAQTHDIHTRWRTNSTDAPNLLPRQTTPPRAWTDDDSCCVASCGPRSAVGTDAGRNKFVRASSPRGHPAMGRDNGQASSGSQVASALSPPPSPASSVRHHSSPLPLILSDLREMHLLSAEREAGWWVRRLGMRANGAGHE
jgi:hypothetical protein